MIYIAHTGDSRCVGSFSNGEEFKTFTQDHKPDVPKEYNRITMNGGSLYKRTSENGIDFPVRVQPGRLAVSRAFGNIEVKLERFGG